MNTPVSFPIAKLLKEKVFNEVCQQWYSVEGGLYHQDEFDNNRGFIPVCECEAPTIAEVIMWLYEKYGIWIEVRHIKTFNVNRFHVIIWDYKDTSDYMTIHCDNGVGYEVWDSPTEAYEAAIEYTLNNLIK